MTDWRQIQARIRKAKNSPDALTKLLELFERTHDAMVAWELGAVEEKAEHSTDAAKWYTIAAQRFRRSEWKTKAEEALTRLGVALPSIPDADATVEGKHSGIESSQHTMFEQQPSEPSSKISAATTDDSHSPDLGEDSQEDADDNDAAVTTSGQNTIDDQNSKDDQNATDAQDATGNSAAKKKRRRGRRGGRGRRRKEPVAGPSSIASRPATEKPEPQFVPPAPLEIVRHREPHLPAAERRRFERIPSEAPPQLPLAPRVVARVEASTPQTPSERTAHGRSGDPALASRMAHLESMLRRLVASPLRRLDEADKAPAGPGVFLLSDSDQTSSYYIEACQTLRVGLGNLARGNRGGKTFHGRGSSDEGVKSKLAEHLGIHESKVSQYLKDHCVVRWLQLDDDAPYLAHFAISILRTPLNLE